MTLPKGHKECNKCGKVFPYEHSYIKNCQSCRNANPSGQRHHLPKLLADQNGICPLCNEPLPKELTANIHIDHIYPKYLGGSDDIDNLQAIHIRCHYGKDHSESNFIA